MSSSNSVDSYSFRNDEYLKLGSKGLELQKPALTKLGRLGRWVFKILKSWGLYSEYCLQKIFKQIQKQPELLENCKIDAKRVIKTLSKNLQKNVGTISQIFFNAHQDRTQQSLLDIIPAWSEKATDEQKMELCKKVIENGDNILPGNLSSNERSILYHIFSEGRLKQLLNLNIPIPFKILHLLLNIQELEAFYSHQLSITDLKKIPNVGQYGDFFQWIVTIPLNDEAIAIDKIIYQSNREDKEKIIALFLLIPELKDKTKISRALDVMRLPTPELLLEEVNLKHALLQYIKHGLTPGVYDRDAHPYNKCLQKTLPELDKEDLKAAYKFAYTMDKDRKCCLDDEVKPLHICGQILDRLTSKYDISDALNLLDSYAPDNDENTKTTILTIYISLINNPNYLEVIFKNYSDTFLKYKVQNTFRLCIFIQKFFELGKYSEAENLLIEVLKVLKDKKNHFIVIIGSYLHSKSDKNALIALREILPKIYSSKEHDSLNSQRKEIDNYLSILNRKQ